MCDELEIICKEAVVAYIPDICLRFAPSGPRVHPLGSKCSDRHLPQVRTALMSAATRAQDVSLVQAPHLADNYCGLVHTKRCRTPHTNCVLSHHVLR